ncbi:MAG: histidine kinase, partial [Bacteroidota bacterium]
MKNILSRHLGRFWAKWRLPGPSILLLISGLLWNLCAWTQIPKYHHFSVDNGLPSSTLYGMYQDEQGFIWIGSDNGVSRYDGTRFEVFDQVDGLADTEILGMGGDHLGRIWFWTYNKKPCYFWKGRIYSAENEPRLAQLLEPGALPSAHLLQYKAGADRQLYLLSDSAYLRFDEKLEWLDLPPLDSTEQESHAFWRLVKVDSLGQFWLLYQNLLGRYLPEEQRLDTLQHLAQDHVSVFQNELYRIHHGHLQILDETLVWQTIRSLTPHIPNRLAYQVFSTAHYYWIIDDQPGITRIDKWQKEVPPIKLLTNYRISYVIEDHEGNHWFSTLGDGLLLYRPRAFALLNEQDGLGSNKIHSVLIHPRDASILAGHDDGTISQWSPRGVVPHHFSRGSKYNRIRDIQFFANRIFYIADSEVKSVDDQLRNPIDYMQRDAALAFGGVKSMFFDSTALYIGSSIQLTRVPLRSQQAVEVAWDQAVLCGYSVNEGEFYFAGNTGLYHHKNGRQKRLLPDHPAYDSRVNHLTGNASGWIFAATQGQGLLALHGQSVVAITTEDGLSNNNCLVTALQNDSTIWVGTSYGLNQVIIDPISAQPRRIVKYFAAHGLGSNLIHDLYYQDEVLAVGTDKGLNILHTQTERQDHAPLLVINSLERGTETYFAPDSVALAYSPENLRINFKGIAFSKLGARNFQFRLLGLDSTWTTTTSREVHYAGLLPGKYIFELKSPDFKEQELQDLFIRIVPQYWQRTEFKLAMVLGLLLGSLWLLYTIMYYTKSRALERARIKQQLAQLELQALQAQLNPHFISNTLNSIQHFILEKEVRAANEQLSQFAQLMRLYLEHSAFQFTTLAR